MIYNLFLNSTPNNPLTNYHSAITANNRGQRVYAVDWSFLPENKKFEVSFRFASKASAFTANDLYYITTNFGPTSTSLSGGSMVRRQNNNIIGTLKVRSISTTAGDLQLVSLPLENEPVLLLQRPTNNLLEVSIMSNPSTQYNLTTDYLLTLSFTEVK
jgi:hypothetical protein